MLRCGLQRLLLSLLQLLLLLQRGGQLPDLFLKLVDLANAFLLALAQAGFGGDDLAADILQPASRVFADAGKTLLGRYQLLLQQTLLLVTPVTQADQRQIGRASWRGRLVVWLRAVV